MSHTAAQTREAAYLWIRVAPNDVAAAPKITSDLADLDLDIPRALRVLRSSAAPEARAFLSFYDDVAMPATYRRVLPFEAFAVAAGVCPTRLLEVIVAGERRLEALRGAVIAARHHPAIVEVSTAMARLPEGLEDRSMQLKNMGFIPLPKGAQVNVNVSANATAQSASLTSAPAPAPESTIRRMVNRFNDARPAPPALPAAVEDDPIIEFPRPQADPLPANFVASSSYDSDTLDAED